MTFEQFVNTFFPVAKNDAMTKMHYDCIQDQLKACRNKKKLIVSSPRRRADNGFRVNTLIIDDLI